MEINKKDLLVALDAVKPGVSSKDIIEHANSFAFLAGKVFSYNDEISMSHPVPNLGIVGVVRAEELHKLLQKIKQEKISVTVTESELLVAFGKASAGLGLVVEGRLPLDEVAEVDSYVDISPDFLDALEFVVPNCSTDMTMPTLTCVHIRGDGWVEATNNQRIARHRIIELGIEPALIPAHICQHVIRMAPIGLQKTEGWLHFINKAGTTLSCRVFEKGFPDDADIQASMHMEKGVDIILPNTVLEIVDRASIFGNRDHFIDNQIKFSFQEKKLIVSAQNASGWYDEQCSIRYKGRDMEVSLSPDFMANILSKTLTCRLTKNKIGFKEENWEFVSVLISGE